MEGGASTVASDLTHLKGALDTSLAQFNVTNLTTILTAALGLTVTLVIAWFAYRFITRRVTKAMRKGSI